ncbi:MAG TPA: hypothetical protein VGE57_09955 [Solimonas sp.]
MKDTQAKLPGSIFAPAMFLFSVGFLIIIGTISPGFKMIRGSIGLLADDPKWLVFTLTASGVVIFLSIAIDYICSSISGQKPNVWSVLLDIMFLSRAGR